MYVACITHTCHMSSFTRWSGGATQTQYHGKRPKTLIRKLSNPRPPFENLNYSFFQRSPLSLSLSLTHSVTKGKTVFEFWSVIYKLRLVDLQIN
ncbi:hypothetical protein HAX54_014025 [Datura stramonium]|uniref:Uncharacterized protein n=1 Tax=Datura stramonium TaxID=4076 RepID=A0ABS8TQ03_DATST|nr:hypothetical protein [Datura stramonium]